MIRNFIPFNMLVAGISECRKRMTILRKEILSHEETGKDTVHQKRELLNLRNKINQLQSSIQNLQRKSKIYLY